MNSNKLKVIAILTMLIDHIGYALFPEVIVLRIIGRLSFPIFAFMVAEGYHYTKSVDKYMIRFGIFAIVSEIPFDLAFHDKFIDIHAQNIFWTLLLGLIALRLYDYYKDKNKLLGVLSVFVTCILSFYFKTDYYVFGILIIFAFNRLRDKPIRKMFVVASLLLLLSLVIALSMGDFTLNGMYQVFSLISLYLIHLYNGKLGMKSVAFKYLLYVFYPLHLSIICIVRYLYLT